MRFRKKPVEIEAKLLTFTDAEPIARWCGGTVRRIPKEYDKPTIEIETLEGTMTADYGDWIIEGVKGEFYPCKPDIFKATYERIS